MTRSRKLMASLATVFVAAFAILTYSIYRDTSTYAVHFTEEGFSRIRIGMSKQEVYSILGEPLAIDTTVSPEAWIYYETPIEPRRNVFNILGPLSSVEFDRNGVVTKVSGSAEHSCHIGMRQADVLKILGEPSYRSRRRVEALHYSRPGTSGMFHARTLSVDDENQVTEVVRYSFHN
jgi:outer membrane protein assembly factor BamE (lipoprotein component of BamABCDE complex)